MAGPPDEGFADWQELALRWERGRKLLWEATRPVSERMVDWLDPHPGETILDLACGTGETGFLAAPKLEPGGLLISSDRSPNMLGAARRLASELKIDNVEFKVIDSERIELPSESVEGVLSRFGFILKGDPPAALAEIKRILRPGGRLAFAVWAERSRNSWMTVPSEVMVERGHLPAPSAEETRISERRHPKAIALLLQQAGFGVLELDETPVSYSFEDPWELWYFVSELRGRLSLALERLDDSEKALIRERIEARAERSASGGYELSGVSITVLAA